MTINRTLIACNVFHDELEELLPQNNNYQVETIWIQAGLHSDINLLEKSLKDILDGDLPNNSELRLLLGSGCLPGLADLLKERKKDVPILSSKNCIESLVGLEELRELEKNKTMVITPSWIRRTWFAENGLRVILGWDNTDFRQNFGRYDRLLVLDSGIKPLTDLEILEAFEIIEVPIETLSFSLEHFNKILWSFLA